MCVKSLAAFVLNKQQRLAGHGDAEKSSQSIHLFEPHSLKSITIKFLSSSYKLGRQCNLFKVYNENTENKFF